MRPSPVELQNAFEERFGAIVLEGYGMTECGGTTTLNHAGRARKPGSVGTPASGGVIRIAADGEVLLRSPTLMRGHDGWFGTGDIGRIDEDGYLYLLDRKKDVILRGGYTVYPRELEEVLYAHHGGAGGDRRSGCRASVTAKRSSPWSSRARTAATPTS